MCDSHDAHTTDQQTNDTIRHKIKTETCDTGMRFH